MIVDTHITLCFSKGKGKSSSENLKLLTVHKIKTLSFIKIHSIISKEFWKVKCDKWLHKTAWSLHISGFTNRVFIIYICRRSFTLPYRLFLFDKIVFTNIYIKHKKIICFFYESNRSLLDYNIIKINQFKILNGSCKTSILKHDSVFYFSL